MKIYYDLDLERFDAWGEAKSTLDELTHDEFSDEVDVYIYNIKWDKDDEDDDTKLPLSVNHTFDYNGNNDELIDEISDFLSDEYGYCHNGFEYKIDGDEKGNGKIF